MTLDPRTPCDCILCLYACLTRETVSPWCAHGLIGTNLIAPLVFPRMGGMIAQKKPQDGKHSPVVQSAVLGGVLHKEFRADPSNGFICPFVAGLGGPTIPAFPLLRLSLWTGEPCWREYTASPGESQPPGPPLPLLQVPTWPFPLHGNTVPSFLHSPSSRSLPLYLCVCCLSPPQDHFRLLGLYLDKLLAIHP